MIPAMESPISGESSKLNEHTGMSYSEHEKEKGKSQVQACHSA